jgi:hypothetical protein
MINVLPLAAVQNLVSGWHKRTTMNFLFLVFAGEVQQALGHRADYISGNATDRCSKFSKDLREWLVRLMPVVCFF